MIKYNVYTVNDVTSYTQYINIFPGLCLSNLVAIGLLRHFILLHNIIWSPDNTGHGVGFYFIHLKDKHNEA